MTKSIRGFLVMVLLGLASISLPAQKSGHHRVVVEVNSEGTEAWNLNYARNAARHTGGVSNDEAARVIRPESLGSSP